MSDAEPNQPMVIWGSLTGYITTTRSAVNDTVAEMRARTIVSSRSQQRVYLLVNKLVSIVNLTIFTSALPPKEQFDALRSFVICGY